jgi:hypothetical protein
MCPGLHIAIYTDNTNTVDMFHSLRTQPFYNPLLLTAVDLLRQFDVQLRVFHIPGSDNVVADALSRGRFDVVAMHAPHLRIFFFEPPRLTLGAAEL